MDITGIVLLAIDIMYVFIEDFVFSLPPKPPPRGANRHHLPFIRNPVVENLKFVQTGSAVRE